MTRVLVTWATGFVGHVLCDVLAQSGHSVRAALRCDRPALAGVAEQVVVGDITASTDWGAALSGIEAVIHVAARAHVLRGSPDSNLYFETNAHGTQCLAKAAAQAGICRFVYLSSIKVNGEETAQRKYSSSDPPDPKDAYGASKWLGEKYLMEVAAGTGMEAAIVRSPLVYGPGVRANFLRLMRWIDQEWPLPLGAIDNSRSLVCIWNLCDLLVHLLQRPAATGRTWMVSDGEDLSTPDLIRRIGRAMQRRVRLPRVPAGVLKWCGTVLGQKAEIMRLCGSLAVDIAPTRHELKWSPPMTVDEGLVRTVDWYLSKGRLRGT